MFLYFRNTLIKICNYKSKMKKKQANILLVDDQEEILFSLKVLLRKHFEGLFTAVSPR